MILEDLLHRFTEMSIRTLGSNLTGVYLHGSAAMGCFNPQKSDLDLILIVKDAVPETAKLEFMKNVILFHREASPKGLELSVVRRQFCSPFVYPTPFELHFSAAHLEWFLRDPRDYVGRMCGADRDLAAHFTVINRYGVTLWGEKAETVFAQVPAECYIDSILADVENAREDILDNPVYITLNLCRVLAYLQGAGVLSKKSGGEWGVKTLPRQYRPLILRALQSYRSDGSIAADPEESIAAGHEAAQAFAEYMLGQIRHCTVPTDKP